MWWRTQDPEGGTAQYHYHGSVDFPLQSNLLVQEKTRGITSGGRKHVLWACYLSGERRQRGKHGDKWESSVLTQNESACFRTQLVQMAPGLSAALSGFLVIRQRRQRLEFFQIILQKECVLQPSVTVSSTCNEQLKKTNR